MIEMKDKCQPNTKGTPRETILYRGIDDGV